MLHSFANQTKKLKSPSNTSPARAWLIETLTMCVLPGKILIYHPRPDEFQKNHSNREHSIQPKRHKKKHYCVFLFQNWEKTLLKGKYCKWKFKKTISSFLHCKWRIEDNFSEQWTKHKGFLFENCFIMKYPAFCTRMVGLKMLQRRLKKAFLFFSEMLFVFL